MELPQPPQDEDLRNIIEKLAVFVARNGLEFEAMTKQKQRGNPKFAFLFGGEYFNYYMLRLTSEQAVLKHKAARQQSFLPGNGENSFGQFGPPGNQMQQQRFQNPQQMQMFEQSIGPGGPPRPAIGEIQQQRGFEQRPPLPSNFESINSLNFDQSASGPRAHGFQRGFGDQGSGASGSYTDRPTFGNPNDYDKSHRDGNFQSSAVAVEKGFGGPAPAGNNFKGDHSITASIEALKAQKLALEEQIRQSEQNLTGQQQVLVTQQQQQVEDAIRSVQDVEINQLAMELGVNLNEFETILEPIVDNCTKDSISSGKAWIFTHTSTPRHYHLVTSFLLRLTTDPGASFNKRLHIIYLVNDVLHHCMRKGAHDLQQALESIVIPMFSFSKVSEAGNEGNLSKLDKLFGLWESKSNYVSTIAVDKLKNYDQTWMTYQNDLVVRHGVVVTQIAQRIQETYDSYQNQHSLFTHHVNQNIKVLIDYKLNQAIEQQIQQLQQQNQQQLIQQQQQQLQQQQQHQMMQQSNLYMGAGNFGRNNSVPTTTGIAAQIPSGYPGQQPQVFPQQPGNVNIPDISRPPPGFPTPPPDKDLIPALPYFELPAGLMVSLVKLEDDNYKPIDPSEIRLPPPCPPTERLIQAIEAYYGPPSHDRPRDSEGWERLSLYEYFKSKNLARKQKEDDIRDGRREKSRSPSPIRARESSPSSTRARSPPRRRYMSKSPTPTRRKRSRSRSPRRRKSSRRSRSRSPVRRSPTPPSFSAAGLGMDRKLDESNKGHQLLRKMGWGGTGLGANEQGIEAPVSGGDVRDKMDQYKGVGIMGDPFESYRKSKGQAFVERMRARAEDRP